VAGRDDFSADEWLTMRRAFASAGVLVSVSEGGGTDDMLKEVFAITQHLRAARIGHSSQLVRELADSPFQSGWHSGMKLAQYEALALDAIRSATATVAVKAPEDLQAFREFLVALAETAANANVEGGIMGVGGVRVSRNEAVAIALVRRAAGFS
jgi:hypothetical protein